MENPFIIAHRSIRPHAMRRHTLITPAPKIPKTALPPAPKSPPGHQESERRPSFTVLPAESEEPGKPQAKPNLSGHSFLLGTYSSRHWGEVI